MDKSLLQPSIAPDFKVPKGYSSTALFMVAFFGGPLSIFMFSMLHSNLLGSIKKDWLVPIPFLAGLILVTWSLENPAQVSDSFAEWSSAYKSLLPYIIKFYGLLYYSCYWFFHRHIFKAMTAYQNPWAAGITCFMIGSFFQVMLHYLFRDQPL